MLKSYFLQTGKEGLYDITAQVMEGIRESGVESGTCIVFCPHTTAGITLNENTDPGVGRDILLSLSKAFPDRPEFLHAEGNSAAHTKASIIGSSLTIIVEKGRPLLGGWQGVFFCEFDGPRNRKFFLKVT
ncbi:MAG TPA: secondary thiamine-phosphate synthase enzyme YjbQ [Clostridiales bacterium]|jgi:secondary thiamine-phosphate synthase enzyme|nr:secondary thiamine-phosphate synthase enzyme YjbQ [Clostridiales bacterium]